MPDAIIASPVAMTPPATVRAHADRHVGRRRQAQDQRLQGAGRRLERHHQRGHRGGAAGAVVRRHQHGLGQAALPAVAAGGVPAVLRIPDRARPTTSRCGSTSWPACSACSRRFLLACVTAIPIGIAMGMSRVARGIFDPPLEFYRPLPPLAYLPLIIIWFGIDELPKVLLIFLALLRAAGAGRALGHAQRLAGADQRRLLDGRQLHAGDPPRDPAVGAARHPDRHAHRHRLRLDHAGGRRDGRGQRRASARWCSTRRTSCAPTS